MDKVAFTGETATGTRILQLAAPQIKRVSLELGGGGSPRHSCSQESMGIGSRHWRSSLPMAMRGKTAALEAASRWTAPSMTSLWRRFADRCTRFASAIRNTRPPKWAPRLGVSPRTRRAACDARDCGRGKLLVGGSTDGLPDRGYYVAPTVFSAADARMDVVRQEIFGPVTTIQRFNSEQEAIEMANDTVYGLSGSVFSPDVGQALRRRLGASNRAVWDASWGGKRWNSARSCATYSSRWTR